MMGSPHGIVGFDPGNTSAVAAVDLDGRILHLRSYPGGSFGEAVEAVRTACVPLVFASDVAPAQDGVRKLAAAFGCRAWAPDLSLSIAEKKKVVFENYEGRHLDVHERDCLAAALFCLFDMSPLIERAKKKAGEGWQARLAAVLKGEARNLSDSETAAPAEAFARKPKTPEYLRIRILKERALSLERRLQEALAKRRAAEAALSKRRGERPVTIEKVVVRNRRAVERLGTENEKAARILRAACGEEVVILRAGTPARGAVFVRDARALTAEKIFSLGIRRVFCEIPARLPCRVVKLGWQSIFGGEFAIVERHELEIGREEEKEWNRRHLEFLAEMAGRPGQ